MAFARQAYAPHARLLVLAASLAMLSAWSVRATAQTGPAPTSAVTAIPQLELDRYMGQWYEIARTTPNRHERDCFADVVSMYERISDTAIELESACRMADGEEQHMDVVARVRDPVSKSKLELRYAPRALGWLPFVWDDYWVLNVAPDYSYALVGEPGRESLWILSRKPQLEASAYDSLVAIAAAQGYDTTKLARTRQSGRALMPPPAAE